MVLLYAVIYALFSSMPRCYLGLADKGFAYAGTTAFLYRG